MPIAEIFLLKIRVPSEWDVIEIDLLGSQCRHDWLPNHRPPAATWRFSLAIQGFATLRWYGIDSGMVMTVRWCRAGVLGIYLCSSGMTDAAESRWAYPGSDGRPSYQTTASGDRIMDFSYAGYGGGGVLLPRVASEMTLTPLAGDDTGAIQAAVSIRRSVSIVEDAKPFAFSLTGSQILIDRCTVQGDAVWYVATNRDVQGPNVVLNSRFEGTGAVEPHQRWATGLLVDGVEVPMAASRCKISARWDWATAGR